MNTVSLLLLAIFCLGLTMGMLATYILNDIDKLNRKNRDGRDKD